MVDSSIVLWGQTLAYTFYVLVIMAVMAWFAFRVTRQGGHEGIKPVLFYGFVGFLVVCGVSLHIITYNTIPWAPLDLHRGEIRADRVFTITVEKHKFTLPAERLAIGCNEKVLFNVVSKDLTYGFGLFRHDNSMVFQMQVLPGHVNDLLWQFDRPGVYSIRSTEYSGPAGIGMIEQDAVVVTCGDKTLQ
ncbi:MAG: cytochrome C oxidase subunit II [Planctomycetes bacterium]|nr:cytochrome C oxidase subunit II [Planctomycetota bacterium]